MEPVPETERMEAFRSSPLPTLQLPSPTPSLPPGDAADATPRKPPASLRRATEPPSPSSAAWSPSWAHSWSSPSPAALPFRPRTASPLSGFHTRSRSTASAGGGGSGGLSLPGMARTQSMPGVNGSGHLQFGADPRASMASFGTPGQRAPPPLITRTPRKTLVEDMFPLSPTRVSVIHDADHTLHERSSAPNLGRRSVSPSTAPALASLPLARTRRPSSPFRRISAGTPPPAALAHIAELPLPAANGTPPPPPPPPPPSSSYGSNLGLLSSPSIPSTPTSTRSRSPSISSLETIPDSPDAEEAALEAERLAQLRAAAAAAASAEASGGADGKGRSSLDAPPRGRTLAFGSRDKRKRWSVCGAERRGDLDLETIWED